MPVNPPCSSLCSLAIAIAKRLELSPSPHYFGPFKAVASMQPEPLGSWVGWVNVFLGMQHSPTILWAYRGIIVGDMMRHTTHMICVGRSGLPDFMAVLLGKMITDQWLLLDADLTCITCRAFQAPSRQIVGTLSSHQTWHAGKFLIYR